MFTPDTRAAVLALTVLALADAFARARGSASRSPPRILRPGTSRSMPDGTGLPPGGGTAAEGEVVYAQQCALCHGPNGEGGTNAALVVGANR